LESATFPKANRLLGDAFAWAFDQAFT